MKAREAARLRRSDTPATYICTRTEVPHPCGTNVEWIAETRLINISANEANNTGPAFRHPPSSSPEAGAGPYPRTYTAGTARAKSPLVTQ